jgi:hypothetical protein
MKVNIISIIVGFIILSVSVIFIGQNYGLMDFLMPDRNGTVSSPTPTPHPAASTSPSPAPVVVDSIDWAGHKWSVTDWHNGVITTRNVWVDPNGNLHMKLIYENGRWQVVIIVMDDYVGYGTYSWTIATDLDYIADVKDGGNPNFVFSPFLYDNNLAGQYAYGEMDVELSKWGEIDCASNCDWTIWPAGHKIKRNHFEGPNNTYTIEWMPDHIKFSVSGPQQQYVDHLFTNRTQIPPVTGTMQSIISIWQFPSADPPAPYNGASYYEIEVVVSNFEMTPYSS